MGALKIIDRREAVENAQKKVYESMNNNYPGLITRWSSFNKAIGSCFRFKTIYTIAGGSGHGKSYLVNMINSDFMSDLNKNYPNDFKILSFNMEMSSEDEVIREISGGIGKSYSDILSVNTKIKKEDYDDVIEYSNTLINDKIHYVEDSGKVSDIYETVKEFKEKYPDIRLIVTIDHPLLAEIEHDEVRLVSSIYKLAVFLKKRYGAMVIILSQTNDKMESSERKSDNNLNLHYPQKGDLFSSKSSFHDSDILMIVNCPERYGLTIYGPNKFPTKELFAIHVLKNRLFGTTGILRFRQDFSNGNLIFPYNAETI